MTKTRLGWGEAATSREPAPHPPKFLEGAGPCRGPMSDTSSLPTGGERVSVILSCSVCGDLSRKPQETQTEGLLEKVEEKEKRSDCFLSPHLRAETQGCRDAHPRPPSRVEVALLNSKHP